MTGKSDKQNEALRASNEESNKFTKECLHTALVYFMGKKDFDKITISEIANRAGVSRMAFYRNYNSKEEIVSEIVERLLDVLTELYSDENCIKKPYEWYLKILSIIKENEFMVKLLLQADMLMEILEKKGSLIEQVYTPQNLSVHYRVIALESAVAKIILEWFETGMKESIEFIAELCAGIHQFTISEITK